MKAKYVDFFGLAGCGKTTICNELKAEMKQNGYKIAFLQDFIEYYSKHKIELALRVIIETIKNGFLFLSDYFKIFIFSKSLKMCIAAYKNCMLLHYIYLNNEYDYIISDQCLIQNIISCYYTKSIENDTHLLNLIKHVNKCFNNPLFVTPSIDVSSAVERVILRKSSKGRVDKMDRSTMEKVLNLIDNNILHIKSVLPNDQCVCLDSNINTEENVEIIYRVLFSQINDSF